MKIRTILSLLFILNTFNSVTLFAQNPLFSWAKKMGGIGDDYGQSISTDSFGNVYTIGYFKGTVDFDPGSDELNLVSNGGNDVFISKLDSAGFLVWVKQIGGTEDDLGYSIYVDASGYIYISGLFNGTVDFDPGAGVNNLTSAGNKDVFVLKLDNTGKLIWAKRLGGVSYEFATHVTADNLGNVYTSGSFFGGTADFDPGTGTFNLTGGSYPDIFISKLDLLGNFVWAKKIGGSGTDGTQSIITDSSGNVYTTGLFQVTVDFNPGAGIYNLTTAGSADVFILKLDAAGTFMWAKKMGGSGLDQGISIAVDITGHLYCTGSFLETADFDPGVGVFNLTSDGLSDVFVSKLDKEGNFVWAKKMGGANNNLGQSIIADIVGNVYTSGVFMGTADFNPGLDTFNLIAADSSTCVFISKLDSGGNFLWAKGLGGGGQIAAIAKDLRGGVFATSSFDRTRDFNPDSGTFNLTSAGGTDVFVVKLSQCTSTGSTFFISACHVYTSPSNKHTWTLSGIYQDTISNTAGCDSIITINLTIDTVDVTVTQMSSFSLTANATGATYQWLDCNAAYAPIPNKTGQTFTPNINGSYAVIVTKNSCIDTSECINITSVGISENEFYGAIAFYPNPTNGQLTIDLKSAQSSVQVIVRNFLGQVVVKETFEYKNKLQFTIPGDTGLYFLELVDADNHKVCTKVIKQ